jgi:hypothetical protein
MHHLHDLQPHAMCLLASPAILWALVVTNVITAGSYYLIPIIWRRNARHESAAKRSESLLQQIFVFSCGTSHVMMVVTMFVGGQAYGWLLVVNTIMAVASAGTAFVLWHTRDALRPG